MSHILDHPDGITVLTVSSESGDHYILAMPGLATTEQAVAFIRESGEAVTGEDPDYLYLDDTLQIARPTPP